MPNTDTISEYVARLDLQRKRVQYLHRQQIIQGTTTPFSIINELEEARADIAKLKAWLRNHHLAIEDLPDDGDTDADAKEQRAARLRFRFANHTSFINNRIASFVGRAAELITIRQRIAELLPTGGYVTITGQAGQGKSSIIAALLAQHSRAGSVNAFLAPGADLPVAAVTAAQVEPIAHHFIPFNPGPDHQISLLRNLIARLAVQHNLPEIYLVSDSRPALKEYFATIISEIAASGAQEIIYIDGLDQIEEDPSGMRDLSFLPNNAPPGIVFVLGTRPNDTLTPLRLLKPRNEHSLPPLTRHDFDAILRQRQATVAPDIADRFYEVMAGNALFLDLAAQEIIAAGALPPEQIIARLADDPANLFSFAIDRLKRPRDIWREVIKPMLGVLFAARESLSHTALRTLIRADADSVRDALQRLGGLVDRDERGRFYLFHLKLRAFLGEQFDQSANDETRERTPFFDADERASYHQCLAAWCQGSKGGPIEIWNDLPADPGEQERRAYAREHFITHLTVAGDWDELWAIADTGDYGRAKLHHDPSTRAYVQDLDRIRDAVLIAATARAEPIAITLPRLWRYSLLRGSLASQVDNYPDSLFTALAHVGRVQEAIILAEVLSDPARKVHTLCRIGLILSQTAQNNPRGAFIIARAIAVARAIDSPWVRAEALSTIVREQAEAGDWEQALDIARTIEQAEQRAEALSAVVLAQVQVAELELSLSTAHTIEDLFVRAEALSIIARAQAQSGQHKKALATARSIGDIFTRAESLRIVAEIQARSGQWNQAFITANSIADVYVRTEALGTIALVQAQAGQWKQALDTARSTKRADACASLLSIIAAAQTNAGHIAEALTIINEAFSIANTIEDPLTRADALNDIVSAHIEAKQWEQALATARTMDDANMSAESLGNIAFAQAQAGQWDLALATARSIENKDGCAEALSAVAEELAQAGHIPEATALIVEAASVALSIEDGNWLTEALRAVTAAQAEAGEWESAVTTAHAIDDPDTHAAALGIVAAAQAQAGEWDLALATAAHVVDDTFTHTQALRTVAEAQAQAGEWESALVTAHALHDLDAHDAVLSAVAAAQARAGQWELSLATIYTIEDTYASAEARRAVAEIQAQAEQWKLAHAIIRSIDNENVRASALSSVAAAQAQAGQWDLALSTALSINDASARASALSALAAAQAQAGEWEQASIIALAIDDATMRAEALRAVAEAQAQTREWERALATARAIDGAYSRASALSAIAAAQARAGEWESAIATARTIDDTEARAEALRTVAEVHAQSGDWESALAIARTIDDAGSRIKVLSAVAKAQTAAGQYAQLYELIQNTWRHATTAEDLWSLLPLASSLITSDPKLLPAFLSGAVWVTDFIKASS